MQQRRMRITTLTAIAPEMQIERLAPIQKISVIVPVLNEEGSIANVIGDIPKTLVQEIIVVDNGCTDNTAAIAKQNGAKVVTEPRRGYGYACLAGIAAVTEPNIVVFLDGDYSDYPTEIPQLVEPILEGKADFVVGHAGECRKRRAVTASAIRKLAGVPPHALVLRCALDRPRAVSRHPLSATVGIGYAGQNVRLDSRDANQVSENGNANL